MNTEKPCTKRSDGVTRSGWIVHRSSSQTSALPRSPGMASEDRAVIIPDFAAWKSQGRKISVLTAYDHPIARLLDAAGVDCLLVGDSMGTTVQGRDTTLGVTLEQIVYHAEMVARAARKALVVADMPFLSYQVSRRQAIRSSGTILKQTNCQADVGHHGNLRLDHGLDGRGHPLPALELHGLTVGLLQDRTAGADGLASRNLVRKERHIGHHERLAGSAGHHLRVVDDLLEGDSQRRVPSLHGRTHRVADEQT